MFFPPRAEHFRRGSADPSLKIFLAQSNLGWKAVVSRYVWTKSKIFPVLHLFFQLIYLMKLQVNGKRTKICRGPKTTDMVWYLQIWKLNLFQNHWDKYINNQTWDSAKHKIEPKFWTNSRIMHSVYNCFLFVIYFVLFLNHCSQDQHYFLWHFLLSHPNHEFML